MKTLFCNILLPQGQGILIRGEVDHLDRGVYNYHFPPPPPRGRGNVRVMGKKKALERKGNEGGRERRGKGKEK